MLRCSNNYVPLCRLIETEMPRQARKVSGTGIYHVMLRGINRQDIFENRSENRPLIYAFKITNFAPANRQLWYKLCNNMRI